MLESGHCCEGSASTPRQKSLVGRGALDRHYPAAAAAGTPTGRVVIQRHPSLSINEHIFSSRDGPNGISFRLSYSYFSRVNNVLRTLFTYFLRNPDRLSYRDKVTSPIAFTFERTVHLSKSTMHCFVVYDEQTPSVEGF